jgi:ubiquinone/menaquinone biosynthesis C-methylase UbiE
MESQINAQLVQMKDDWNRRAVENACWYINTLRLDQTEEEFDRTGAEGVAQWILPELELLTQGGDPRTLRFLEIGCGIGRMTRHLAAIFGEIHSTDVSGEMIARARMRLADLPNVQLYETSGADVGPLPDDYFDIVYSIFVFQHVPSKEAIRSTLIDAWRVLKPGGLLRFQTNGVTDQTFLEAEKNTWVGETFPESDVRALARQLGARVVSIYAADTLYCFSTLRKPRPDDPEVLQMVPVIEYHGRADDPTISEIPAAGNEAWLSLVVSGFDQELADTNEIRVEIAGQLIVPRYAGQIRPHYAKSLPAGAARMLYVEVGMPPGISPGLRPVRLLTGLAMASPSIEVTVIAPLPTATTIISFRNLLDFGTDIEVTGPKSAITLCVVGLDQTASVDNVRLRAGEIELRPAYVGYDPNFAGYKVDLNLPSGVDRLAPGPTSFELIFKGVASTPLLIDLQLPD